MPYEIGHITKVIIFLLDSLVSEIIVQGATLQFETKIHPNLSDNVSQHKLVTVKVSFVDEQLKRQLLYIFFWPNFVCIMIKCGTGVKAVARFSAGMWTSIFHVHMS